MIHKFKWYNNTSEGYIESQMYPGGFAFDHPSLKPKLATVIFDSLNYDEELSIFTITVDGKTTDMTDEEKAETREACLNWDADISNDFAILSLEELRFFKKKEIEAEANDTVALYVKDIMAFEMSSWRKQEEEARAWDADNNATTPMIDILLAERYLNETKAELVNKIISKADYFITVYTGHLARYQRAIHKIHAATTKEELEAITF